MYRIPVTQLRPGMRLGRSVLDGAGRILLQAGTPLTAGYIQRLSQMHVMSVYVWNELALDVMLPDVVSEQSRQRLSQAFHELAANVRTVVEQRGKRAFAQWNVASLARASAAVADLVDELWSQPEAVIHLQDVRSYDTYTFAHSVGVCLLAVVLGMAMGYDAGKLRLLGMGALLHDVGKLTIPEAILKKPGSLSAEEMAEVQQHAWRGFEILCASASLSYHVAHVAWQHHERWCGGGYPRALRGEEIHELARLVAVADVYDAMTSDRPYRPAWAPHQALAQLSHEFADWFDPRVLAACLERVAPYPVGTVIELSDRRRGVVVAAERGRLDRPRVRVLRCADGSPLASPYEIELRDATGWRVAPEWQAVAEGAG